MGLPRIYYGNGKTIDLPKLPRMLQPVPFGERTINRSMTGEVETIRVPRMDISIRAEWSMIEDAALLANLENWAQRAQAGDDWSIAFDSAKTVDTLLSLDASAGDAAFYVEEPTGIVAGQVYKLIDGPYYQLVTISTVVGDLVTITGTLDDAFSAGAIFRDRFYFPAVLVDPSSKPPIQAATVEDAQVFPPTRFLFTPEFYEDISQGDDTMFRNLAANLTGTDVNTAQQWFPTLGAFAVAANTTYRFSGYLRTSRAAGANSHTTGLLFGGSATLTSIAYKANCNTGDTVANIAEDGASVEVATLTVVKAASTSTTEQIGIRVEGTVRINGAGTFIPQFQFSAAPGGAPTILANSFFELEPIGSGSVASEGTLT